MESHATIEVDATSVGQTPVFTVAPPQDLAFETSGHEAAVFMPRFGQAHQQYLCAV